MPLLREHVNSTFCVRLKTPARDSASHRAQHVVNQRKYCKGAIGKGRCIFEDNVMILR
jgi:hypothetical protein